jgi:hypothetical protein
MRQRLLGRTRCAVNLWEHDVGFCTGTSMCVPEVKCHGLCKFVAQADQQMHRGYLKGKQLILKTCKLQYTLQDPYCQVSHTFQPVVAHCIRSTLSWLQWAVALARYRRAGAGRR